MKKIIISLCIVLILVLCSIRIYYINTHGLHVPVFTYNPNEEVNLDKNFFGSIDEVSDGYAISVLNTSQITVKEFKRNHNIQENIGIEYADYIGLIHVKISNYSNTLGEKRGINMQRFILQNNDYITYYAPEIYSYFNIYPDTLFSLAQGTEQEFWIPFLLKNENLDINEFNNGHSYLIVSLYPQKCRIQL